MSEYQILTVLAAFAFFYSLIASRLERTPISGAVVYLFVGLACGPYGLRLIELNVDGETGGYSVGIDLCAGPSFGFNEDAVTVSIGESDYLVFNGGTVSHTRSFDDAGIER